MIHYALRCGQDHGFDGWFNDSAGFEAQAAHGLLECPVCGDVHITRALMAPAVAKKAEADAPPARQEPKHRSAVVVNGGSMPAQVRSALQKLRSEVERNCDYVGHEFADEARRIHRGETDPRGIYGETSAEQAESLADEGIQIARIPWIPRADG